jgi:hypothetical protein
MHNKIGNAKCDLERNKKENNFKFQSDAGESCKRCRSTLNYPCAYLLIHTPMFNVDLYRTTLNLMP